MVIMSFTLITPNNPPDLCTTKFNYIHILYSPNRIYELLYYRYVFSCKNEFIIQPILSAIMKTYLNVKIDRNACGGK